MILVGIVLILLGCVFFFAGATGMPRAILGVEKEPAANVGENTPSMGHNAVAATRENPSETTSPESNPAIAPDEESAVRETEGPQDVSPNPPGPPVTQLPPSEVPASRRISSLILGIIGIAFGVLAVLDAA